jgi:all-trans-retinol 13,14-reductase
VGFKHKNGGIDLKNPSHEIVIVGAGMAGLTAAAYLSRARHDVLLIEKNDYCGGLLTSFQRDGFLFDVGARSIENSGAVQPLLKDLGISLDLVNSPVSVGIEDTIIDFSSEESLEEYKSLLAKLYPRNISEIDAIFSLIDEVYDDMVILSEIDNPIITGMKNMKYVFKKLLPYVIRRFIGAVRRINQRNAPVEQTLNEYTSNQSLIDIIAQHFFKNTPTSFALGYFHTYLDYYYPKGGTGQLSESLKQKAVERGTLIKYETEIRKIFPSENRLTDTDGKSYIYENLIWCADLKSLYRCIKLQGLKKKNVRKILNQKQNLHKTRGGDSVFTLFLGVNESLETFQSVSNGHFFYTPSRNGLGKSIWTRLHKIITNFEHTPKKDIMQWLDDFCSLNTFEISIPGLRDSSLTPEGKTGLVVSLLFEYDLINKVREAGWYEEFKTEVENRIIETLNSSIYPNIKDKILLRFSSTPISISNRVKTSEGAITGWTFERPVPVVQDLLKIFKSVKTPIPNVLQAGQWVYSPSGIPIAILTGVLAAKNIIKKKK